jgi:chromosome segregation protein
VLGEQSARQLRGARMDDVIFAGNATRRPLGMAEVTLTFDNSDGALATPFSEIGITRRAYRTGESEFFINKTAVRLRDITDMLMGTGLAAELAAIVSQGEIDAILSAKPEARRELFEGVAGTARYRARKREAQRRLEQTAVNALRVNDLLVELEKQMPAIEQQVRRAKRYQKVQQQLRDFEIFSYVRKTAQRRNERTGIVEALSVDDVAAAKAQRSHDQLLGALNHARDDEYQAGIALDERNATHARTASELAEHATVHASLAAKMTELERSVETLEQEADASAAALSEADARLSRAIEDLRHNRELRDEALASAESAAAAEAEQTARWEQAYAALRAAEDARARAVAKATESNSAVAAGQAESERWAQAAARIDEELRAARAALERCEKRASQAGADRKRLADELLAVERKLQDATGELSRAASELEKQRGNYATAIQRATEARAKLNALTQFEAEGFGAPAGTRKLVEAIKSGKLGGVVGTVASQLTVDERYAVAIDALLGPRAHDLLVKTLADAKAAMRLLKEERAGRATIVVLETLEKQAVPDQIAQGAKMPGLIGRASDLVRCDPKIKRAIERILGGSYVVADLDSAFACAQSFEHAAFATPDGDVIRRGAITSGSTTGALGAVAARESLEAEARHHEAAARDAAGALARATQLLTEQTNRCEALKADAAGLEIRRHDADSLFEHLAEERATLEKRIASLRAEREDHRKRSAANKDATATNQRIARELASALDELERQRRSAIATADELAALLSEARTKHRSAAANAAALVERVAQLSDDVESARTELERAQVRRKDRTGILARTRDELAATRASVEQAAGRKLSAEKALAEVAAELAVVRERRDAAVRHTREVGDAYAQQEQAGRERSIEVERRRIRLAEIDAELALLSQTFSQNPATPQECDEVAARYGDFEGDVDAQVRRLREEMLRLGNVNLNALEDRAATLERCEFLRSQLRDLEAARANIVASIAEMDAESLRQFNETFAKVSVAFSETFTRLFNGGQAKIWVAEAEDPTEAGIEISAQPPGKKMQNLNLLSGGERALTAVALIFATLQVRPSPFYIFDEIDAALDEANIGRFGVQLAELAGVGRSQIIIITHNKATMTLVDRMYGVTTSEPGVSNILSLSLERAGVAR